MRVMFELSAMDDYSDLATEDKRVFQKIRKLIKDILRNGCDKGEGRPERLKGDLSGLYSREIDKKNRLVYYVENHGDEEVIVITSCKGHYDRR